jgi:hypothetical protein
VSGQTAHFFLNQTIFTIMKTKLLISSVLALFLFNRCDQTIVPVIGCVSPNSFIIECTINGEVLKWNTTVNQTQGESTAVAEIHADSVLLIRTLNPTHNKGELAMAVELKPKLAQYQLSKSVSGFETKFTQRVAGQTKSFRLSENKDGELTLLSWSENTISGHFQFEALSKGRDSIRATDGYFHLPLKYF